MKWIGQHIWDFISRFRSTVYIENLETSSEENVLVVDSDGKVTKNTTLGGSDLTITDASNNRIVTSSGGSALLAETYATFVNTGNTSSLYLFSNENVSDYISFATTTNGSTRIQTVDADAALAHLTFVADGDTIIQTTDSHANKNFKINNDSNTAFLFSGESGNSSELTIYEMGGDSAGDFINIKVEEHGATTIQTTDASGSNANIQITADGTAELAGTTVKLDASADIELNADSGNINFKDGTTTLGTIDSSSVFMKQTKVTLSESDCNDLHNTPVTLVAAQGTNKIIVPVNYLLLVDRDASTAQSASGCDMMISYDGSTTGGKYLGYMRRFMYNESGDRTYVINGNNSTSTENWDTNDPSNKPLKIAFDSACTSGSLDSIVVYTTYYVVDNS